MNDPGELRKEQRQEEDRSRVHVHIYQTVSLTAENHQHLIQGTTGPARETETGHDHRIRVRTSFFVEADSHWHWYDSFTGPPVFLPEGGHIHTFDAVTAADAGHIHGVYGTTGRVPDRVGETVAGA